MRNVPFFLPGEARSYKAAVEWTLSHPVHIGIVSAVGIDHLRRQDPILRHDAVSPQFE